MLLGAPPLLTLAIVLLAGMIAGNLARRVHLPAVTGQVLIGVVMGPSALHLFESQQILDLRPLTHFALGLIAVQVGSHLSIRRLHNAKERLLWLLLLESTVTPGLVFGALYFVLDVDLPAAVLLSALSISTAPATVLALVKEARARGVFVKTLVAAVALNNIACIAIFELAHAAVRTRLATDVLPGPRIFVLAPLVELVEAIFLGGLAGWMLTLATARVARPDRLAAASLITILLTAGMADYLDMSPLLACMALGIALANITPDREETGHAVFSDFEAAIFAVFFTLAGMELEFDKLVQGGWIVVAAFAARFVGKLLAGNLAMRLAGATRRVRAFLGFGLLPQAGVAVGLMVLVKEDPMLESFAQLFLAVGLALVTVNEIVGPLLARVALKGSGETGKDRARLIDFLREENIVIDLEAGSKEEAIEKLTDVLVTSNHLDADRQELLDSILERERATSTCVGGGLAVPHGVLPEGPEIVGAMGISRDGLPFPTPDHVPVHCMVVLATPAGQRDRHLEVLAALARAIGMDPLIQHQVFNADTPAHAYEVLHAEESEDFNYFLEDPEEDS